MDYKNGRIYQILNTVTNDVYVGSTCQPLSKRMAWHRKDLNSKTNKRPIYAKMNEIGIEHFYIELLEECPCESREQLRKKEGHYIREIGTLNCYVAGRVPKEYREEHKDKINKINKQYREEHKDTIKEFQTQYRETHKSESQQYFKTFWENNKELIKAKQKIPVICECNHSYTKVNKARHLQSKVHITWLSLQNESPTL